MDLDDDDDFGDFGGFEAAEVVGQKEAEPLPEAIAAVASPWAFIPSLSGDETAPKDAPKTEVETVQSAEEKSATGAIPDIDLDKISPTQVAWASWSVDEASESSTAQDATVSENPNAVPDTNTGVGEGDAVQWQQEVEKNKKQQAELEEAKKKEELLASQLEAVNEDKAKLTEKLESLTKLLHASQERVEEVEDQLTKQEKRYDQLQTQHEEQIESLKKAGNEALAIIVEEYKEVCQTALHQQQAAFEIQIKEVAKQQLEAWNESIKGQDAEFKDKMSDEKEKLTQCITDTMTKLQEENKVQLDAAMASERERSVLAVETAIQSERSASKVAIEEALHEQRSLSNKALEQHQEHLLSVMEEERGKNQQRLDEAMEKHKEYIQENVKKIAEEERVRSDEHLKKSVAAMEEEVRQSMKQRSQAEAAVRHRALSAIDLFLNGAREQLKVLLETKTFDDAS